MKRWNKESESISGNQCARITCEFAHLMSLWNRNLFLSWKLFTFVTKKKSWDSSTRLVCAPNGNDPKRNIFSFSCEVNAIARTHTELSTSDKHIFSFDCCRQRRILRDACDEHVGFFFCDHFHLWKHIRRNMSVMNLFSRVVFVFISFLFLLFRFVIFFVGWRIYQTWRECIVWLWHFGNFLSCNFWSKVSNFSLPRLRSVMKSNKKRWMTFFVSQFFCDNCLIKIWNCVSLIFHQFDFHAEASESNSTILSFMRFVVELNRTVENETAYQTNKNVLKQWLQKCESFVFCFWHMFSSFFIAHTNESYSTHFCESEINFGICSHNEKFFWP